MIVQGFGNDGKESQYHVFNRERHGERDTTARTGCQGDYGTRQVRFEKDCQGLMKEYAAQFHRRLEGKEDCGAGSGQTSGLNAT